MADWARVVGQRSRELEPLPLPIGSDAVSSAPDAADAGERTAIIAVDANIPADWAAGAARLFAMPRPHSVPSARWDALLDAVGRFLDRWAAEAARLGWQVQDVFGCDLARPVARVDRQGLLWLLGDAEIVELSADAAVLHVRAGARLTFRRAPWPASPALAWDLSAPVDDASRQEEALSPDEMKGGGGGR